MPGRTFYVYSADAIVIAPVTGNAALTPGFRAGQDRLRIEVGEDNDSARGDALYGGVDDNGSLTASVFAADGSFIGRGAFCIRETRWYKTTGGATINITVFEMDGHVVGYSASDPLHTETNYIFIRSTAPGEDVSDPTEQLTRHKDENSRVRRPVCFGPGTMISTDKGDIPVEWLETTDKVLTRDHGFQPILWIGRTRIKQGYFEKYPDEAPVCIPAGALGPNCPTRDLRVTGDHRIMIRSAQAELEYFSSEVLAPARAWVDAGRASSFCPQTIYTLTHILCACHQLIVAEGAWVETMFTGEEALRRLPASDFARVQDLLGADLRRQQTARLCLSQREARLLLNNKTDVAA